MQVDNEEIKEVVNIQNENEENKEQSEGAAADLGNESGNVTSDQEAVVKSVAKS